MHPHVPLAYPSHDVVSFPEFMMKGLVSISALALALAPVVALAQQPAPAEPAPAAPPPAAPAPVIGGPTAAPDASQPGAAAAPATAPAADTARPADPPKDAPPDPLIWRGTTFTWTNAASTTMLGLGGDQIGYEDEFYGMDWVLAPQLFVLDLPDDKIILQAEAGVGVEITDSGTTTKKREPQFRDTQLGVAYNRNIWASEDKEWSTKAGLRARAVFPSSPTSRDQGRYLVASFGATLTQQIRLLGNEADGLNNLTVQGSFTYSHLFARSYQATNPDLERTRQSASGQTIESDVLSTSSMDIDRVIPGVTFILPLYKDLSLTTAFRLVGRFRHQWDDLECAVNQPGTGCVPVSQSEISYITNSTFDIALTQPIYDMLSLNVGYNNETLTLGEDGQNRNIFYSPGAQFYIDLVANIDVIYAKASGREEVELPPGPRNLIIAGSGTAMPSF